MGPEVPFRAIVGTVILSELSIPRPAAPTDIDLADPSQFERVLTEAGFEDVSVTEVSVTMRWATPQAYADSMRELGPFLQDLIEEHDLEKTETIWDAVAEAAADHIAEDGTVRLMNQAFMGVGVRPQ